jgi:hypothetical protein
MDGELDYLDPVPCCDELPRGAWLIGSIAAIPLALLALALLHSFGER